MASEAANMFEDSVRRFLEAEGDPNVVYIRGPHSAGKSTFVLKFIWDCCQTGEEKPWVIYLMKTAYEAATLTGFLRSRPFCDGALEGVVSYEIMPPSDTGIVVMTYNQYNAAMEAKHWDEDVEVEEGEIPQEGRERPVHGPSFRERLLKSGACILMDMATSRPGGFEVAQALVLGLMEDARSEGTVVRLIGLGVHEHEMEWIEHAMRLVELVPEHWSVPTLDMGVPAAGFSSSQVVLDESTVVNQQLSQQALVEAMTAAIRSGFNVVSFLRRERTTALQQVLMSRASTDLELRFLTCTVHATSDPSVLTNIELGEEVRVRPGQLARVQLPWIIWVSASDFCRPLYFPKVGLVLAGGVDTDLRVHEGTGVAIAGVYSLAKRDLLVQHAYVSGDHAMAPQAALMRTVSAAKLARMPETRPSLALGDGLRRFALDMITHHPEMSFDQMHPYAGVYGKVALIYSAIDRLTRAGLVSALGTGWTLTSRGAAHRRVSSDFQLGYSASCLAAIAIVDTDNGVPARRYMIRLAILAQYMSSLLRLVAEEVPLDALRADCAGPGRRMAHVGNLWAALGIWEKLCVETHGFVDGEGAVYKVAAETVEVSRQACLDALSKIRAIEEHAGLVPIDEESLAMLSLSAVDLSRVQVGIAYAWLDHLVVYRPESEGRPVLFGHNITVVDESSSIVKVKQIAEWAATGGHKGSPYFAMVSQGFTSIGAGNIWRMQDATAIPDEVLLVVRSQMGTSLREGLRISLP